MKSALLLLLLATPLFAQVRPVNTYSIVARDPVTGQMGVAVQSHWFAVGQIVPWAEAGVGAVATQSFVDPTYGKLGLDLMRAGKSAPDTLRALLGGDAACEVRQVGIVDANGVVATFTGSRDIVAAGGIAANASGQPVNVACGSAGGTLSTGRDFAVQANLMARDTVWPAMAKAFGEAKGDLAERMLAALDAAQASGGDIRGKQSAALIVVNAKSTGRAWQDKAFDVRVDDHANPLAELRRLVALQRAYNHMNAGDLAVEHKDHEAALREYSAAEKIAASTPGVPQSRFAEMLYWHAVALVNMKRVDEALPVFARPRFCVGAVMERAHPASHPRRPAAGGREAGGEDRGGRHQIGRMGRIGRIGQMGRIGHPIRPIRPIRPIGPMVLSTPAPLTARVRRVGTCSSAPTPAT